MGTAIIAEQRDLIEQDDNFLEGKREEPSSLTKRLNTQHDFFLGGKREEPTSRKSGLNRQHDFLKGKREEPAIAEERAK